ncbi:MAG: hypothetical protein ACLFUS_12480 [Candidatus Sumerlaeia bacterium]
MAQISGLVQAIFDIYFGKQNHFAMAQELDRQGIRRNRRVTLKGIEQPEIPDMTEIVRLGHLNRAHVTHIMNL